MTRRDFHLLSLSAAAAAAVPATMSAKVNSVVRGVPLGAQSYSFRTMPLDGAIQAMTSIGLGVCELYSGHVEPAGLKRDEMRKWRETADIAHFHEVRDKFRKAGVELYAYNYSFREDFSDLEIERGFEFAKALGVKYLTASSTVPMGEKLFPHCEKHGIVVAFHGHSSTKEGEFASPASFEKAMKGREKWIKINLDIGHFWAAGYDPIEFIEKNHQNIVTLHIKDRKKNQGDNMSFGEGDTPIIPVLKLLRDKKYKIPANIEYEYKGAAGPEVEVKKCFEYCKKALES